MLNVYHALKIGFCTCLTDPIEYVTNQSNVNIMNNEKSIKKKCTLTIHEIACFCYFRLKYLPHEKK